MVMSSGTATLVGSLCIREAHRSHRTNSWTLASRSSITMMPHLETFDTLHTLSSAETHNTGEKALRTPLPRQAAAHGTLLQCCHFWAPAAPFGSPPSELPFHRPLQCPPPIISRSSNERFKPHPCRSCGRHRTKPIDPFLVGPGNETHAQTHRMHFNSWRNEAVAVRHHASLGRPIPPGCAQRALRQGNQQSATSVLEEYHCSI